MADNITKQNYPHCIKNTTGYLNNNDATAAEDKKKKRHTQVEKKDKRYIYSFNILHSFCLSKCTHFFLNNLGWGKSFIYKDIYFLIPYQWKRLKAIKMSNSRGLV